MTITIVQSLGDVLVISVMCIILLCMCVNHMFKKTPEVVLPVYNLPRYSLDPPPDPTLPKYVEVVTN
jgi:hypothetical protein